MFRHLKNGDILLVNRQPTLHKPSIMAHKVSSVIVYISGERGRSLCTALEIPNVNFIEQLICCVGILRDSFIDVD